MRLSARPPLDTPVEQALVELLRESRGITPSARYAGAWRQAALLEGVDAPEPEPSYALSPRSTRGATRA